MISLDSIYENIIAEVIVLGISFLISKISPAILRKEESSRPKKTFDILNLGIFLTSVAIINLILNISFWNKPQLTVFLTLATIALAISTGYVYHNQCPNCKRFIKARKVVEGRIIKNFTRDYKYQPMKIWHYSNGNIWKKEPIGQEKIRTENWVTKQEFYECSHCKHTWDSGHFDVNLDEKTRPQNHHIKTDKIDPNEPSLY